MTREWNKFADDELLAIWRGYQQTEFRTFDVLKINLAEGVKEMRLTPMEIIRLVDELFIRLEKKKDEEDLNGFMKDLQ